VQAIAIISSSAILEPQARHVTGHIVLCVKPPKWNVGLSLSTQLTWLYVTWPTLCWPTMLPFQFSPWSVAGRCENRNWFGLFSVRLFFRCILLYCRNVKPAHRSLNLLTYASRGCRWYRMLNIPCAVFFAAKDVKNWFGHCRCRMTEIPTVYRNQPVFDVF